MRKLIMAILLLTVVGTCVACTKNAGKTTELLNKIEGLKLHYTFEKLADKTIKDESGNGYDGALHGINNMNTDYESGATFLTSGAYVELPSEAFAGEDTLTISIWLKNYSGAINTSAMFLGTTENMPVNYWLLNPCNGYIGKSSYLADTTYSGFVRNVRIYNTELSQENVKMLYEGEMPETMQKNATETNIFIADRADPYVTKGSDGYYYFTASYPMYGANDKEGYDRIILRRAKTIEGLKDAEEKVIWDEKESSTAHRFIWAPEIHEINGKWYVYFAASGQANNVWDINCHVIACDGDDPYNDTWTDKGKFQAVEGDSVSFTGFSLDMTYFECNGTHYVSWAQKVGESNVYLATIDPEEPWKTTSKAMLLTKPEYYWERVSIPVNEGPATMIQDGKIYLAFSASATGPEYCIGLMYADVNADLMDINSWTKMKAPLLTSEDLIGEYGPGHNSFVQDENGDWVFVYHSRSEECYKGECGYGKEDPLYDPCRSARIRYVKWGEDGLPILNQ